MTRDVNEQAYDLFLNDNSDNTSLQGKYVVFVNGELKAIGKNKIKLIEEVYATRGNIEMYVKRIGEEDKPVIIDTPEFIQ